MPKKITSILILLIIIISILNVIFLRSFWGLGFNGEDWIHLFNYKNHTGDFLAKFVDLWKSNPFNWAILQTYLGLLDQIFPANFSAIQIVNVAGKIIASVLIFIPIFTLTKNKLLAVLSSLFFAVSYSSAGLLEHYLNGLAYWGISFLSLFITSYYLVIKNKGKPNYLSLVLSVFFLYMTIFLGFLRVIGILPLIVTVEIGLVILKRSSIKESARRLIFFFLPLFVMPHLSDPGFLGNLSKIISGNILKGNWIIFINPLSGLGLTLIPEKYGYYLGTILITSFNLYLSYILKHFAFLIAIIFFFPIILPVKLFKFIFRTFFIECLLLLTIFIMSSNYTNAARYDALPFAIIGSLILSFSASLGIEWFLGKRKDIVMFTAFISPLLSLYFIAVTWLSSLGRNDVIYFSAGIDRYLTIPAIGISIFLASLLLMALRTCYSKLRKIIVYTILISLIFFVLLNDYTELQQYFGDKKDQGLDLAIQKTSQESFYNLYLKDKKDLVVYYVASSQKPNDLRLERALVIDLVGQWAHMKQSYSKQDTNHLGCLMALINPWYQKAATIKEDGHIVFRFNAMCPVDTANHTSHLQYAQDLWTTIPLDRLFAFTISNGQIVNITQEIKSKIEQNSSL